MTDEQELTLSHESRWYAVQARIKQEQRAAINLMSCGVTTFLPMVRQARQTGSVPFAAAPLFPRYLFVRCEIVRSARKIQYTRGVARMLGTSEGPTPVDDTIIESIRNRIGKDGFVQLTDDLKTGDPVEIMSGPLRGFVGIFHSVTPAAQRVVLLLNAVTSQMRVSVDSNIVRKLQA
jgi:transcriptional antiterminator RfaH